MPFNGSGSFSPPGASFPAVSNTLIEAAKFNAVINDIATNGLSNCVTKNGQTTITANLPMAGFKFTGLGAGSADGDSLRYQQLFTTGNVTLLGPLRGPATMLSPITASLAADVDLNNTANYFTGPTISQGTSGTWFVSGTVTLTGTVTDQINVKLWDGTTVISSCAVNINAATATVVSLSGYITNPAGDLKISARDTNNTNGKIIFNSSGNSKDSTITAIRIA